MLLTLWDLGAVLAVLSIILVSSSLAFTEKSIRSRLELAAKIISLAFLVVAFYLVWQSLA